MAGRIGPLTVLLIWLALGAPAARSRAQTPPAIASGKGKALGLFDGPVEKSSGARVVTQVGRSVRVVCVDPTLAATPLGAVDVPAAAFLWDLIAAADMPPNGGVCSLSAEEFRVQAFGAAGADVRFRAKAGDFLRGLPTGDPERTPMSLGRTSHGLRFLIPSAHGLEVLMCAEGRETERFGVPLPVAGEQTPGWGLGYRMTSRIATPFFAVGSFLEEDRPQVLFRSGSSFAVKALGADSKEFAYGPAPDSVATTILNFDHVVPPLPIDWDRDGRGDLVLTDPGHGTTILYRGAGRSAGEPRQPDQIFRESGWALSRAFGDFDGDGRDDLCLGTVPKLNLLEQVQALRSQKIPVRVTIRRQLPNGGFESAPSAQARCDMPILMALTRNRRTVRFRAPIAVVPWGKRSAILVAEDATLAMVLALAEDGTLGRVGALNGAIQSKEAWVTPFDPPTADFDGDGRPEVLCVLAESDAGDARIFLASVGRR